MKGVYKTLTIATTEITFQNTSFDRLTRRDSQSNHAEYEQSVKLLLLLIKTSAVVGRPARRLVF